jgi:hypothetical protein
MKGMVNAHQDSLEKIIDMKLALKGDYYKVIHI